MNADVNSFLFAHSWLGFNLTDGWNKCSVFLLRHRFLLKQYNPCYLHLFTHNIFSINSFLYKTVWNINANTPIVINFYYSHKFASEDGITNDLLGSLLLFQIWIWIVWEEWISHIFGNHMQINKTISKVIFSLYTRQSELIDADIQLSC